VTLQATSCRSCGAEILWVKTTKDKNMPLDAEPSGAGEFALEWEGEQAIARKVGQGYTGDRYTCHFVTCPDAKKWRRS